MPKVKVHRQSPTLDMTAMTDVAFLLLTFFMLTAKMRQQDPISVDTPSSVSNTQVPTEDIMTVSIDNKDHVFMMMDNQIARATLINRLNSIFSLGLSDEEMHNFEVYPATFGVPSENLKAALQMEPLEREGYMKSLPGIPCDTVKNELANWIYQARYSYAELGKKVRIVIKADNDAKYPIIQQVLATLKAQDINAFNLITDLEKGAAEGEKKE